MKYLTTIIFIFSTKLLVFGQNFSAVLLSKADSTALSYAAIKLSETGEYTTANDKGEFHFLLPNNTSELHFEISFVGCHTSIKFELADNKLNTIYVECSMTKLKDVVIEGLSAKEIVKRAVASIPLNYSDSSYASQSFYRQYQKVNGKFKNLIEAQSVVLFNLNNSKNEITAKEALYAEQLRRSNYYETLGSEDDDFSDFFNQNPIYHLKTSSLNPKAFSFYVFSFDTSASTNYVINYTCNSFSSENHGLDYSSLLEFNGESEESGKFIIDKESFAFIKIEKRAFRNKGYNYPKNNNFILPDRKFTEEFIGGQLLVEYEKINGKWYLKTLLHSYTNEFFRTQTYEKAFTITEYFEWYSEKISRYIAKDQIDKLYFNPNLSFCNYLYDKQRWQRATPSFYYCSKEEINNDLEKIQKIELQFEKNGK